MAGSVSEQLMLHLSYLSILNTDLLNPMYDTPSSHNNETKSFQLKKKKNERERLATIEVRGVDLSSGPGDFNVGF